MHAKQSSLGSLLKTIKKRNPTLGRAESTKKKKRKRKSSSIGSGIETVKKANSSSGCEPRTNLTLRCGTETRKKKSWNSEWGTKTMEHFLQSGTETMQKTNSSSESGTKMLVNQEWCFKWGKRKRMEFITEKPCSKLGKTNLLTFIPCSERTMETSIQRPYIHDDLLFYGILSRLPVITVLRFRCVNKLWNTRLHDPSFTASHSIHSFARPPSILGIIVESYAKKPLKRSIHFCFMESTDPNYGFGFQITSETYNDTIGHCNGLICLKAKFGFGILNPCTHELLFHRFTQPIEDWFLQQEQDRNNPHGRVESSGFGFDPIKKEYKYVHIFVHENNANCFVRTLGTNSWRDSALPNNLLDYFRASLSHHGSKMVTGFYANGSLHWFAPPPYNKVMSFNLHSEDFRVIAGPDHPWYQIYHSIVRWREFLCLVFHNLIYTNEIEISLYMLTGHHEDERQFSWSKEIITFPHNPSSPFTVVDVLGDLFWMEEGEFRSYNPQKAKWDSSCFPPQKGKLLDGYGFIDHVDNLLSLKTLVPPGVTEVRPT